MSKSFRVGGVYIFVPNVMDLAMPQHYQAVRGQRVRVVRMRGAPPPGTMGQVHIADADSGKFLGMVSVRSLVPPASVRSTQIIGRVRRNPDDFRHDDGGSERRRLGEGGIEAHEGGGITAHGPRGMEIFRLLTIRSGLRMESVGLKMSRGVSCLKLAKQVTGLKAQTAAKMLPLYEAWLRERGILKDEGDRPVRGNPAKGVGRYDYNAYPGGREPDWSQFDAIEVTPLTDHATERMRARGQTDFSMTEKGERPDVWCVFGHYRKGGVQAITDCDTLAEAKRKAERYFDKLPNPHPRIHSPLINFVGT